MVKVIKIFLNLLLSMSIFCGFAQEVNYSFHNYTLKDGLAGNNVYCATQDKEGLIWFGTETGLSMFDGTHFKSYTVADGLPDNEIINIFTDSKGRVWLVPFKKALAYIYKRKIFNKSNNTVLQEIKILGNCYNIKEDNQHNIIVHDTKAIHILNSRGIIINILAETLGKDIQFLNIYKTSSGNIFIISKREVFRLEKYNLIKIFTLPAKNIANFQTNGQIISDSSILVQNSEQKFHNIHFAIAEYFFNSTTIKFHKYPLGIGMLESINNKIYTTTSDGVNFIDINNQSLNNNIVINKAVNRCFIDIENNTYLLTSNAGVFFKSNTEIKNKIFLGNNTKKLGIDYINGNKKKLFIAATLNNPIVIYKNNFCNSIFLSQIKFGKLNQSPFGKGITPICYFNEVSNENLLVASINGIFSTNKKAWKTIFKNISIKYIQELEHNYLIAIVDKLLLVSKSDFKILDTLWNERTIASNLIDNSYYIGTIDGLYKLNKNKVSTYLGDSIPIFQRRISAIKKGTDGTIWVGTYDAGVVAYKNGKVLQVFNDSNGLTSNICRNLFINGNYLWVGTDKGLNKIDISKPPYKIVINYTTTDGLASNMINAVYTDSNMVYVGTPEGLTFFDETKIVNNSTCDMRILGVTISGKEQQWDSSKIIIKHEDNNIRFDFVALSFKSAGDISYRYKLVGLDKEWKTTRENYLSYPSLPSGNYTLEIEATNKFGVKSGIIKVDVEIEKLLMEKIWFKLLLLFIGLALAYWYFNNKIRKERKKVNEQIAYNEKINDMEQMALKAQMNPHFIFNCLNSIQEFVITGDVQGANKFITDFSKLIRGTLDNSSKKVISIDDEVKYLTNYLSLEQYRFENKFLFNILIDKSINVFDTYIPPMLMQPYLENAIRHGINNKKEGKGLIQVNIVKLNNNLVCEIIDNGIGIVASQKLKGDTSIEYQSKGMSLTAKRIQLLNKNVAENIVVKVEDVPLPQMGTRVTITIPNI